MSGRGKPRKDARRAKRLKRAADERSTPAISGAEEMVPENVTLTSLDDTGGASKGNKQFPPLVEEVFDIAKIVGTDSDGDHIFSMTVGEPEQPPLLRCADDDLAAHVPQQLKQKIWANKFINIALLLKGNTELTDMFSGGLLQIADDGKIEAKPRTLKEKVANIDKWSDAFLIFASIYLQQFPDKVQQLLKYMAVIRDAASKYPVVMWRTYEEQFRMRQSLHVSDWGKINPDLWMRTMTSPEPTRSSMPSCRDFNKGFCSFARCRFRHSCDLCGSYQHGMFRCTVGKSDSYNRNLPFRGSTQNKFIRGRGYRGRGFRGTWAR